MRRITRRGADEVRSGMTGFIEQGIDALLLMAALVFVLAVSESDSWIVLVAT